MDFIAENLLTILILLPVVGAVLMLAYSAFAKQESQLKWLTLGFTVLNFIVSLFLFLDRGAPGPSGFYFEQNVPWIKAINTNYHVGVDGLSFWLVILTTFIMPIAVISTWHAVEKKQTAFYIFLLLLESAMIGVFVSLDLLVFYLFFEASLVPMFFLIGVWGGANRIYAAIKFFIFTALGSLLMLVAIIAMYYIYADQTGLGGSWDFVAILAAMKTGQLVLAPQTGMLLFLAFALAFAIKVPLFPFHTWLPDAHTEAPTAGSVILAAILLKMGTYGLMRFNFALFPDQARETAWIFITLAIIGIIYGALVAMVQPDMKKLVAYSSVSHLGFVMLGIWAATLQSVQGALLIMIGHGLSTGALFLLIGMLYERRHTREIADYGGLARVIPMFSLILVVTALASIGLPGLNGFVGEFLVLLGTFQNNTWVAFFATTGVILSACYALWLYRRVVFGKLEKSSLAHIVDMTPRELATLAPLVVLTILFGVYPAPILDVFGASVENLMKTVQTAAAAAQALTTASLQ